MKAELGSRDLFSSLTVPHYFNHAAVGPLSDPAREAALGALMAQSEKGLGAIGDWLGALAGAKAGFAELVGVSADDVAFVQNTTVGVTAVAMCFPWAKGDRVLVFEGEFPANFTPWQRAASLYGLTLVRQSADAFRTSPDEAMADLESALDRGVRLVAVSAVEFQTGLRMPLDAMAERCHAHGARLFVDGIQGCGVVPIDGAGVDFLAAGSHKWLGGTFGGGFLAVRPEHWDRMRPYLAGWLSHVEGMKFLGEGPGHLRYDRPIRRGPAMFEGGGFPAAVAASLGASIGLLNQLGVDAISAHVATVLDPLEEGLVARDFASLRSTDPARRSGILAVRCPPGWTAEKLAPALAERGVSVSTPDGNLRFAAHWLNRADEVPAVLAAVDEVLAAP